MAGKLLIFLTLIANVASAFFYFRSAQKVKADKKDNNKAIARTLYYISVVFLSAASFFLFYLFVSNQFQYSYVFRYSSRDLPLGLLISSFWAGQEGSFLLWTLLIGLLGIFYMRSAKQLENWGMLFVNIVQLFFLVMLVQASPFALMDRVPPDGNGLNALLQNFWMIIHPPILFIGYAAATFPFTHSLAALIKNDFSDWVKNILPPIQTNRKISI